ncbi:hypothetical protein ANO14919_138070 [Xylariales sp. No.14919]|nr:hypothetical protein ANO14919_138070 [Xylariales sp. No.14919]
MPDYSEGKTNAFADLGGYKSTGNQPISSHDSVGVIKPFVFQGKSYQGFVTPENDITYYRVRENNSNTFTVVNSRTRNIISYVSADSYWTYNGNYDLYQFFYGDGTFVGLGSMHVHDLIDGETDILYRGIIPSNNWDPIHDFGPNHRSMAKKRVEAKNKIRAPAPLPTPPGQPKLYHHRKAFDNPDHKYIILAGPLLFSPECDEVYADAAERVNRGEFDSIPNEGTVVTRESLVNLLNCVATQGSLCSWDSACGPVYPMYCLPSGFWTWAPLSKPGVSVDNDGSYDPEQFLAGYHYRDSSTNLVDPRIHSDGTQFYRDMAKRGSSKGKGRGRDHDSYASTSSSSTLKSVGESKSKRKDKGKGKGRG